MSKSMFTSSGRTDDPLSSELPDATVEYTTHRPTATRVVAGTLLAGPVGALAGFAFRKKQKQVAKIKNT